jgi:glycosyltransferase involved in cell wall biosynthesis
VKVSVIVPTRNRAHLVGFTIDSILQQTFRDFELIVVDDCSEDDTEKVVKSFRDSRLRYFKHDNQRLAAANRNYGMSQASGEYIAFCDDDDLWLPEKLEKQLSEFEKDPHIDMVCSNGFLFDNTGDIGLMYRDSISDSSFTFKSLLRFNPVNTSSVIVKKNIVDDIGGMTADPVFRTGHDYEFWLRIARKYQIRYLNLPLTKVRVHAGHLKPVGVASIKHIREMYCRLRDTHFIGPVLYWWLTLRMLAIELLWRTRAITLVSRLWRLVRR